MAKKVLVLHSGGLDSTVLAYRYRSFGWELGLLHIYYGQRHLKELDAAVLIAGKLDVTRHLVRIAGLGGVYKSSLMGGTQVPAGPYTEENIQTTIVPHRNATFITIAAGIAADEDYDIIALANHGAEVSYPDCSPEFILEMRRLLKVSLPSQELELAAPFTRLTKAEIVDLGYRLDVPFELTWSCYRGGNQHCGTCPTCLERKRAFELAEVPDPTSYL